MITKILRFSGKIARTAPKRALAFGGQNSTRLAKAYSTQYNYNYQTHIPPRPSWTKRILYTAIGLSALSVYGYFMWWPKHTFPSSVAKILRKGLWAESDKGENDYQLALKYYLEALKHCDEIGLDSLSDEYTGIQLKIGEMFERLGMKVDADFIYNEIATLYLKVLTAEPGSKDAKRVKSNAHRAHLIQKDLRMAIKLVELNKDNGQLSKAILITHLLVAQQEVEKRLGGKGGLRLFARGGVVIDAAPSAGSAQGFTATVDKTTLEINSEGVITTINKNPMAWDPYADEFFNAMDLLTAICISTGDLAMASKVKISMTEWMLLADVEPHKILMSQCNLASLLYLQAEEFESKELALSKVDTNSVKMLIENDLNKGADIPPSELLSPGESSVKIQIEREEDEDVDVNEIRNAIVQATREQLVSAKASKEKCIELSIRSYEAVLDFAKGLPQETVNSSNVVSEAVALATYGLGVVHLHLGEYPKAERLLREARVRSKTCGYQDLITEIERELGKLFKEQKLKNEGKVLDALELQIEMDIQFKKQ